MDEPSLTATFSTTSLHSMIAGNEPLPLERPAVCWQLFAATNFARQQKFSPDDPAPANESFRAQPFRPLRYSRGQRTFALAYFAGTNAAVIRWQRGFSATSFSAPTAASLHQQAFPATDLFSADSVLGNSPGFRAEKHPCASVAFVGNKL